MDTELFANEYFTLQSDGQGPHARTQRPSPRRHQCDGNARLGGHPRTAERRGKRGRSTRTHALAALSSREFMSSSRQANEVATGTATMAGVTIGGGCGCGCPAAAVSLPSAGAASPGAGSGEDIGRACGNARPAGPLAVKGHNGIPVAAHVTSR